MEFKQEFFDDVRVEIESLIKLHWDMIALNKEKIKLNPDWDRYASLEGAGHLRIFTVRDEGTLVGYFVVIVGPSLHYKDHLFAENDVLFLHPEWRKGLAGVRLIKFAESHLRSDGVSVLHINTKGHASFSPVLDRIGYREIEKNYAKYLGD